ncbi:hypothetical protein GGF37_003970, partial [Kickxella alabastrina]
RISCAHSTTLSAYARRASFSFVFAGSCRPTNASGCRRRRRCHSREDVRRFKWLAILAMAAGLPCPLVRVSYS